MKFIIPNTPQSDLARKYLKAMMSLKMSQAKDLIFQAVEKDVSIKDIYLYVFQPVQYEVGWLWETGEISVGQEH